MKPALRPRSEAEDLTRIETVGGNYPPNFRPLTGQCAGLVEQHCVDLPQQVERAPVLDQDALLRAERQCR